eukprot:GHVU01232006.1.p1 GENE.GHVU01232006.1~~GHVU01232006.1.p1  ORF type:complete len:118 (-),score=5.55 GHVU01232006.1:20-373(-)
MCTVIALTYYEKQDTSDRSGASIATSRVGSFTGGNGPFQSLLAFASSSALSDIFLGGLEELAAPRKLVSMVPWFPFPGRRFFTPFFRVIDILSTPPPMRERLEIHDTLGAHGATTIR